ncbi:secreted RxLR effector protein 161-like [Cicer arietinum]|uniref:secreted RxLR effector protein 161-like n=1 Tax=Cicer arietinum TaxID=3827 RepID=UPI003CC64352
MFLLCLYVDDLLVTKSNSKAIEEFKEIVKDEFEMTYLGKLSYFLGIKFTKTKEGLLMHQKKYVGEVIRMYNMVDCNPTVTPIGCNAKLGTETEEELDDSTLFKQVVASLRYLCNTRPDIFYSVGVISRLMENPRKSHWLAAKKIMRYIKGTFEYEILFATEIKQENGNLVGYSDSDWCRDKGDRRSTKGYLIKFMKTPIARSSMKQPVIALSSCEVEYIAGSYAACQALWLESLIAELKIEMCKG